MYASNFHCCFYIMVNWIAFLENTLKIQQYSIVAVSIHLNIFSQTFHLTFLFPNWLLIKPERGLVKYCI